MLTYYATKKEFEKVLDANTTNVASVVFTESGFDTKVLISVQK